MSAPDFSALKAAIRTEFSRNFDERNELGASVTLCHQGEVLLQLSAGIARQDTSTPWCHDTLIPVWSATKGPAAVCALHALDEQRISLDQRVADLWPAFAKNGKSQITFAQLLSHCAGLSALDNSVSIFHFEEVIAALEAQQPLTTATAPQAYHARTFGFLLDQIIRLATGAHSLGEYFNRYFGSPMQLDFWIGLPETQSDRVGALQPAKIRASTVADDFAKAYSTTGSLTQRTFSSLHGMTSVRDLNRYEIQKLGIASFGGVGSATGLASFYAMLANQGIYQDRQYVSPQVLSWLETTLHQQLDGVLQCPIAFGAGVMKNPAHPSGELIRQTFSASARAYGHPGAGGSLAFADPARNLSFAYVMNQMEMGAMPNEKSLSMVRAIDTHWPL